MPPVWEYYRYLQQKANQQKASNYQDRELSISTDMNWLYCNAFFSPTLTEYYRFNWFEMHSKHYKPIPSVIVSVYDFTVRDKNETKSCLIITQNHLEYPHKITWT